MNAKKLEQWKKKQAQTPDGWKFSPDCYGEDTIKKWLPVNDKEAIQCNIYFVKEFDRATFRYTGESLIKINVSLYTLSSSGTWVGYGLGRKYTSGEKYQRQAFKHLVEVAKTIEEGDLLKEYNQHKAQLLNAVII